MVTQMNFNFWTLDEKHEIVDHDFSLPLGPLLFDEMRVRVLEIIQKTEQKFYWDDGFSRVSLNNRYDVEAAVNWSFLSSKISGNEPEVQIWFDSERNPSDLSIAAYMRTFRSVASKAKNAASIRTSGGQWNYLQRRRAEAEAKKNALTEKEQEMDEREDLLVASEQSNLGYFEDAHLDVAAYETYEEFDCEKDIDLD